MTVAPPPMMHWPLGTLLRRWSGDWLDMRPGYPIAIATAFWTDRGEWRRAAYRRCWCTL